MKLVFLTNMVHHHQLPLADEFYKLLGDDYCYIATQPLPDWLVKGGYDPTLSRPYIIRTYLGEEQMLQARKIIDTSTMVIVGSAPDSWTYQRKKNNLITFHYNERWLKKRSSVILHPRYVINRLKYYTQFRSKQTYLLCASAFAAGDAKFFGAFPHKCFKWGYFTKVDEQFDVEEIINASVLEPIQIMWCARFLKWKHPELPVLLANKLKSKGYNFIIDMFGGGEDYERINHLINQMGVNNCVRLRGNLPNEDILKEMRNHSIFLFTSDRYEGWGAVLNESLGNGCAVVASNEIGSVPYVIKDGVNGLIFQSKKIDSLYDKVTQLIDNPELRNSIRREAVRNMREIWSPMNAAKSFLNLSSFIINNNLNNYKVFEGPASWDLNN